MMNLLQGAKNSVLPEKGKRYYTSPGRRPKDTTYKSEFWTDEVRKQVRRIAPFEQVGIDVHPKRIYPYLKSRVDDSILDALRDSPVVSIEIVHRPLRTSVTHEKGMEVAVYYRVTSMRYIIYDAEENIVFDRTLKVRSE